MIKVGDTFPKATVKHLTADGLQELDVNALLAGKKVVLFAVPGAYTPTCSAQHLPGYIKHAEGFKEKGVGAIVCLSVNDPFVMAEWAKNSDVGDAVVMLPDGNGTVTKALGLDIDLSVAGLGTRSQRFAMLIEDGKVTDLQIEAEPPQLDVSSAESMLARV